MRSMSMLQLLGGVAVAGAVAAGTTAFTAGGIDASGVTMVAGGTDTITVEGATLDAAEFITGSTAGTYDHITGMTVDLSGTGGAVLDSTSSVSVAITGSGGDAVSGTDVDCGAGSGDDGTWTCTILASKYFTTVTGVDIKVAAVAG